MIDFDVNEAVVITIGGLGTAFVVLAALIVLTRLMGRFLGGVGREEPAESIPFVSQEPAAVANPEVAAEGLEVAPAQDARLVAAVAAAVAMAEAEDGPLEAEAAAAVVVGRAVGAWKSHGRWELMASRMAVHGRRRGEKGSWRQRREDAGGGA